MSTQPQRDFVKQITRLGRGKHMLFDVYRDFCEMAALSLYNAVTFGPDREEREQRYLRVAKRYDRDELTEIAQLLAFVTLGLEVELCDFLGEAFGELEQHNSARGQFFTPFDVSYLMAELNIGSRLPELEHRDFIRVQEPTIGSGGMVLAFALAMQRAGHNYQQQLHVVGADIDCRAVHMAYIQLSLAHIPAVIYLGNTLTMEFTETWYTPAHILGGWDYKLRQPEKTTKAPVITDTTGLVQTDLFGEVAA